MRNNAAYLPENPIVYIIFPESIHNRASFRIFAESHQGNMVRKSRQKIVGMSYAFRVQDIVRIYDEHARSGLSNREILRRYIWPKYRICEKTFYNIINASADPRVTERIAQAERQLTLFG